MRKYQFFYLLFFLALASIVGFSVFSDLPPIVSCDKWKYTAATSTSQKSYLNPVELVVKPWGGQHQVYGTFVIPPKYRIDGFVTITLPGKKTYCGQLLNVTSYLVPGLYPQPKNQIIRGYLNTRLALWLIIQGKGGELKQPQNWRLGYVERLKK
ncbi:hypothetical protein IQ259_20005 [Fortiea sp. LEGE XX443]|uniref:hypothetical protein n=1 Tax=Fortiea sp. LEGE XX443 TaxID=1828611 RepID=UPI001881D16E|nr:hypothetical protein [Fortiea sp. LEGE XX443]MBE9007288.1 hypothetical protein [Fortiea sp. LEGE XX443]